MYVTLRVNWIIENVVPGNYGVPYMLRVERINAERMAAVENRGIMSLDPSLNYSIMT